MDHLRHFVLRSTGDLIGLLFMQSCNPTYSAQPFCKKTKKNADGLIVRINIISRLIIVTIPHLQLHRHKQPQPYQHRKIYVIFRLNHIIVVAKQDQCNALRLVRRMDT